MELFAHDFNQFQQVKLDESTLDEFNWKKLPKHVLITDHLEFRKSFVCLNKSSHNLCETNAFRIFLLSFFFFGNAKAHCINSIPTGINEKMNSVSNPNVHCTWSVYTEIYGNTVTVNKYADHVSHA